MLFDGAAGVHLPPQARNCGYVFPELRVVPAHDAARESGVRRRAACRASNATAASTRCWKNSDLTEVAGPPPARIVGRAETALLHRPRADRRAETAAARRARARPGCAVARRTVSCCGRFAPSSTSRPAGHARSRRVLRAGRRNDGAARRALVQSGPPAQNPGSARQHRRGAPAGRVQPAAGRDPLARSRAQCQPPALQEFELDGPYFPGRLIGDQVWLCIRPDVLSVAPRNGRPGMNQIPAALVRRIEKPDRVRLDFPGASPLTPTAPLSKATAA